MHAEEIHFLTQSRVSELLKVRENLEGTWANEIVKKINMILDESEK